MFLFFFFFFFSRSTFLSEYHTVAQSLPNIIQTVCPRKQSFASTGPEYFSRPHLPHKDGSGGHNVELFFCAGVRMQKKKNLITHIFSYSIFSYCSMYTEHVICNYKRWLTNFE